MLAHEIARSHHLLVAYIQRLRYNAIAVLTKIEPVVGHNRAKMWVADALALQPVQLNEQAFLNIARA